MLDFVLMAAAEDGARPFPEPVVGALQRVVPCDTVAYRAWSSERIVDRSFAPGEPDARWKVWEEYPRFRDDDPHPSESIGAGAAPDRTGQPLVLSEAISGRSFWKTGLYFDLMRPFGVRDVLKLFLPRQHLSGTASAFVLDTSARAFTEDDRTLLTRLVPALAQLQRNATLRAAPPGGDARLQLLTPRELTIVGRVAGGETNQQIATALFIGVSTVRKHLEHVYEKLEVRNRAAAAAVYTTAVPRARLAP